MTIPLLIAALRTVPAVRLERVLRFPALATIDAMEALSFQAVAIALALADAGVWSFACADAVSSATATGAAYCLSPWSPWLAIRQSNVRKEP